MARTKRNSKASTGINESYIGRLQSDSKTDIGGDIGAAYKKLVAAGIPESQVAGLSSSQLKALQGLEGNELTQSFQKQLGETQSSALSQGQGALSGLANGDNAITEQSLANGANTIVNSTPVQTQIDAMNSVANTNRQNLSDQVNRQLNESSLPSIYRDSQSTGGSGSSRSAISEGIARRVATESISKGNQAIDQNNAVAQAQLRGNVFNTGLSAAMQSQQSNLASQQSAANSLTGLGMSAGTAQAGLDQQHLSNLQTGGALEQTQAQNKLNNNTTNALNNRNRGVNDINSLQGMLGNLRNVADTTTSGTTSQGSMNSSDYAQMVIPAALGKNYANTGSLFG